MEIIAAFVAGALLGAGSLIAWALRSQYHV